MSEVLSYIDEMNKVSTVILKNSERVITRSEGITRLAKNFNETVSKFKVDLARQQNSEIRCQFPLASPTRKDNEYVDSVQVSVI